MFLILAARAASAQPLPELPRIALDGFGPGIREQVRAAEEAARKSPRDAAAVGRLAMILHAYDEHALAAPLYERARILQPAESQWPYLLAVCREALGDSDGAAAGLREVLRMKSDFTPARLRLADLLFAAGAWDESRAAYDAILSRDPDSAPAWYGLGRVKARARDRSAIAALRKAVALAPAWGAAHYALALALRDAGEEAEAARELALHRQYALTRPLSADPAMNAVAALNVGAAERLRRGVALEADGRLAESIAEHEGALRINPRLLQAWINLIQLYGRTGEPARAEEAYRAAVALDPNQAESHYNFGVLLMSLKRNEDAAAAFQRALESNPQFADARLNYGALLEQRQRFEEAAEQYRRAVESRPNDRKAHFQLARMLIFQGDLTDAIRHLQQTLRPEDDQTPRYVYALAAAYVRAGDKANGLRYARLAREQAAARGQTELLALIERDLRALEQAK